MGRLRQRDQTIKQKEKERNGLFFSEKSIEKHLRHRPDDSEKIEKLLYRLDGTTDKHY